MKKTDLVPTLGQSLEAVVKGVRLAEVGYLLVVAGLLVIYFLSSRSRQKTSKRGN